MRPKLGETPDLADYVRRLENRLRLRAEYYRAENDKDLQRARADQMDLLFGYILTPLQLHRDERDALISGLVEGGPGSWDALAHILKCGTASTQLVAVVGQIFELGAYDPRGPEARKRAAEARREAEKRGDQTKSAALEPDEVRERVGHLKNLLRRLYGDVSTPLSLFAREATYIAAREAGVPIKVLEDARRRGTDQRRTAEIARLILRVQHSRPIPE